LPADYSLGVGTGSSLPSNRPAFEFPLRLGCPLFRSVSDLLFNGPAQAEPQPQKGGVQGGVGVALQGGCEFKGTMTMTKTIIGRACFVAALVATVAFAQQNDVRGCESESNGDRRAASNAVVFWNEVAGHSIVVLGGRGNALAGVEIAIVHNAVYDAVNAVCGYPFTPYAVTPLVRHPALPEAAAAAAAHRVLVALYPDQREELDRKYADFLEAIPGHHRAKLNGVAAGRQAAAGILDLRAGDGRYAGTPWDPPEPGPGVWERTPPGYLPPATPWIRDVTPWTMASPSQFRVAPPPDLNSDVWVTDYQETKDYGGKVSHFRTAEQTDVARFIGGVGVNAVLQWNDAWRGIASDQGLSTLDAARLFAMLSTTSSDAFIACWDSKFTYALWRPVTAIRAGGGNPSLEADPDWIGLVITPNHPEYPAAHGCVSGSIIATLQAYFGTDELSFTMSSVAPELIQPVRHYDRFSRALDDILNARIYGGMHYRNSTEYGSELGRQVARQLVENFFLPQ
jgi:hypothetical protein